MAVLTLHKELYCFGLLVLCMFSWTFDLILLRYIFLMTTAMSKLHVKLNACQATSFVW